MRTNRIRIVVMALTLATPLLMGCGLVRRAKKAAGPTAEALAPIPLRVKNDNYLDMNVAVVIQGMSRRVGMVPGNSTANFSIERTSFANDELSLTATPIGGSGRALSGNLTVHDGDRIEFRIAPILRQSVAVIR